MDSRSWNRLIVEFFRDIEGDNPTEALITLLGASVEFDDRFIVLFRKDSAPVILAHSIMETRDDNYLGGPYLLDPFYDAWNNGLPDGCYRLSDIAPEGFEQSQYFINYFSRLHVHDEIGYFASLDSTTTVHMSLGRTVRLPTFSRQQNDQLDALTPLVRVGLEKIKDKTEVDEQANLSSNFHAQFASAFSAFGTSFLTQREVEVSHFLLKGHSAKSIARLLGISPGTVRNHLKNIYSKLEISSQAELFALFLESLSAMPEDCQDDPLDSLIG